MNASLNDKVCIVAGGGNGIGAAVAGSLADHGATVVVNDLGTSVHGVGRDESVATEVAEAIQEKNGEAMAHPGDAADLDYTRQLVTDTLEEYGRIDAIVNFAGILQDELSYKLDEDDWDAVLRSHLRSHYTLLRAVASHWRNEAGDDALDPQRTFLGVSALSALGNAGQLNYASANAGVLGFVRAASTELFRYGIRVNALVPSAYTRMTETIPEEHRPYTRDEKPPEAIGPVVAYLCSGAASDITGVTVKASGNQIGIISDPEISRVGVNDDGWSVDSLDEAFRDEISEGYDLTRTDRYF